MAEGHDVRLIDNFVPHLFSAIQVSKRTNIFNWPDKHGQIILTVQINLL